MSNTLTNTVRHDPDAVPRSMLLALGALVLLTLLSVIFVRFTGVGLVKTPDAPAVSVREFRFVDKPDGSIAVLDASLNRVVETVAPGTNGFLRGTMRGLARERNRRGIGQEIPFQMIGRADGKLTLEDPATGRRVDLGSFGPTNAAVFAHIMSNSMAAR